MMKQMDEKQTKLFNEIMDKVQKDQFTLEELEGIMEHVRYIFYTDGTIKG